MRRPIVIWPDKLLEKPSRPLTITESLSLFPALADDMWDTMMNARGVGISAVQVGIPVQVIVLNIEGKRKVFVNPTIEPIGERVLMNEGCLSLPGFFEDVLRFPEVIVSYLDPNSNTFFALEQVSGLEAHVLQHEYDHLLGKLFIEDMPRRTRNELKAAYKRLRARAKEKRLTVDELVYGK